MLRDALDEAIFDKDGSKMLQLADASDRRNRDGSYGQLNSAFPAIRCLDSQDNSVRVAEQRLAQESRTAPVLGPLNGPDLSARVAGQARAQAADSRRAGRAADRGYWDHGRSGDAV